MELEDLLPYLGKFLPFPIPEVSLYEYLTMSEENLSRPAPIDITDPILVEDGERVKVMETCPYEWMVSYWDLCEELERLYYPMRGRYALSWYLCLLQYYNPRSLIKV